MRVVRILSRKVPKPIRKLISPYYYKLKNQFVFNKRQKRVAKIMDGVNLSYTKTEIEHVIVLVVDCLRKDHLSVYGCERDTSPFLGGLAKRSLVFNNCFSASPWTFPSVASIFTGLFPHAHGGVYEGMANFQYTSPPKKPMGDVLFISEVLAQNGFATLFSSAIATSSLCLEGNFNSFFQKTMRAEECVSSYISWIKKKTKNKTFSYLHFGDLHIPLDIRVEKRFGSVEPVANIKKWDYYNEISAIDKFENYKKSKLKLYDSLICYVDSQIKRLFSYLEENDLVNKTLLVITADHGEEFWDHFDFEKSSFLHPKGLYGVDHGQNLWNELINIPLILFGVGGTGFKENLVSNVDLMPTILDLCGVNHDLKLDGINFLKEKRDYTISEGIAYGYEKKAVIKPPYKLIYSKEDGVKWLFNLESDPKEQNPVLNHPMIDELMSLVPKEVASSEENVEIDEQMKERLGKLGYFD